MLRPGINPIEEVILSLEKVALQVGELWPDVVGTPAEAKLKAVSVVVNNLVKTLRGG